MHIAFLTNNEITLPLATWLSTGETVDILDDHKAIEDCDLIISYNYRYIVPTKLLNRYPAINLHMSLLPWNRGAHPIYWSARENTPMGVTIHWMTPALDRGEIIAQRTVSVSDDKTLGQAYQIHLDAMFDLFRSEWRNIKRKIGTVHAASALPKLANGWATTIAEVRNARA